MDGRDAWASPPLITLEMMKTYVVAYTERLRDKLGAHVITRGNWGDARSRDIERFFTQKIRCSPGTLSVLDPDLFELGPARVKAFADSQGVAIAAGIDASLLTSDAAASFIWIHPHHRLCGRLLDSYGCRQFARQDVGGLLHHLLQKGCRRFDLLDQTGNLS